MIGLALALWAGSARAAEADVPMKDWCALADLVVVAEATSSETLWTDDPRGGLQTRWWLSVQQVVKGPKLDTVELVLPGGSRDGVTLWVSDLPELGADRTFVVLLAERDGAWVPAVGSRSALPIRRHPKEPLPAESDVLAGLGPCR